MVLTYEKDKYYKNINTYVGHETEETFLNFTVHKNFFMFHIKSCKLLLILRNIIENFIYRIYLVFFHRSVKK